MNADLTRIAIVAAAGVAIGIGALVLFRGTAGARQAIGQAFDAAGEALNPANPNNLAYRGVNAAGAAVTGREFSFGADIRDAAESGLVGASATGIGPLDFVVDTVLYPVNLAARAVRESARSAPGPSGYDWTNDPQSPFHVGA